MSLIGACGDDVPIISTGEDGAKDAGKRMRFVQSTRRQLRVKLPDRSGRRDILRIHTRETEEL